MSSKNDKKHNNELSDDEMDIPDLEEVPVQKKSSPNNAEKPPVKIPDNIKDYTRTEEEISREKEDAAKELYAKMAQSLKSNPSPAQNAQAKQVTEEVKMVKPNNTSSPIVQEISDAFSKINLAGDSNFIQQIMSNKILQRGFSNPKVMTIINQMTTNPQVYQQYANDPEFGPFLKEYMGLLANKFDKLSKDSPQNKPQTDDFLIKERKDPEIENLVSDPEVRLVIEKIQREGRMDFYELARAKPQVAQKIKTLIDKGFFQIQR